MKEEVGRPQAWRQGLVTRSISKGATYLERLQRFNKRGKTRGVRKAGSLGSLLITQRRGGGQPDASQPGKARERSKPIKRSGTRGGGEGGRGGAGERETGRTVRSTPGKKRETA